jgi:hypothetical protein
MVDGTLSLARSARAAARRVMESSGVLGRVPEPEGYRSSG